MAKVHEILESLIRKVVTDVVRTELAIFEDKMDARLNELHVPTTSQSKGSGLAKAKDVIRKGTELHNEVYRRTTTPRKLTGNPAIDEILSGIHPMPSDDGPGVSGGINESISAGVPLNIPKEAIANNPAMASVADALNRDYSAVIKKAAESTKRRRGQ